MTTEEKAEIYDFIVKIINEQDLKEAIKSIRALIKRQ